MTSWDADGYQKRVFDEMVKLIRKRDPGRGTDEVEREARSLLESHVRAAPMPFLNRQRPPLTQREWIRLQKKIKALANELQNLPFDSKIVLSFCCSPLPHLNRVPLDLEDLSRVLQEGLKKRLPPEQNRPKDVVKEDLVEEATEIFQKARGISLDQLSDPNSQHNKKIKKGLNDFVEIYIPDKYKFNSRSALSKYMNRFLKSRCKSTI